MASLWYYTLGGQPHGPVPAERLKELAAEGLLQPDDMLWLADGDPRMATEARGALDFSALRNTPAAPAKPKTTPLPDWLGDVQKVEQVAPPAPPPTRDTIPDWLDDARREAPGPQGTRQPPAGKMPDWLGDVAASEPTVPAKPIPSAALLDPSTPIPGPLPLEPIQPVLLRQPIDVPTARTSNLAMPEPSREAAGATQEIAPVIDIIRAEPVTIDVELIPLGLLPAASAGAPAATEVSAEQRGYDPVTGQIRHPEQYQKWLEEQQRRHEQGLLSAPALSLQEVFLQARKTLERWVDAEDHRLLITESPLGTIRCHPEVQTILQHYRTYGPEMEQKLLQYVDFLVENRRKFHASRD